MKGINEQLNEIIKQEVLAKEATKQAKEIAKARRPVTRQAIEYMREQKELKANLELSC
tara:strand:- start:317 stop:490 length:174 start_codon:yes stop_codon:yes gene_type:complete